MENASDALIMAGQVLIFIIALTVCISSFTTVRAEVNRIVGENEEIRFAKNGDNYINYIDSRKVKATRVVGSETVVSSMYRAIKENYVIYIKLNNPGYVDSHINKIPAVRDINVNGEKIISAGDPLIEITIGPNTNQYVNAVLSTYGLFNQMSGKSFYEYLGEYQEPSSPGVATENKQTYRIITYVEKT